MRFPFTLGLSEINGGRSLMNKAVNLAISYEITEIRNNNGAEKVNLCKILEMSIDTIQNKKKTELWLYNNVTIKFNYISRID